MKNPVVVATLASGLIAVCHATSPTPVPENLLACGKLQDAGERVRCYDVQIAAMTATQFGEELLPPNSRAKPPQTETALLSSIREVSKTGPKQYVISLSNGQVWRQEGSQIPEFFRAGDAARIERGALGSYHMSTAAAGAKNWVLVTRIQ